MKSSKKRSRKSKLVPRECLDSDDENIADMQKEIEQTIARMTSNSILKKLNRQPEEPLKFSIKVEVEEVDEPTNVQIKQHKVEKELNITIDSVVSLKEPYTSIQEIDLKDPNKKPFFTPPILRKGPNVMQCIFNEDMIKHEFERISKQTTNVADKLIEIHMLNSFGRYASAMSQDDKELKLQSVIEKWKYWYIANPKRRDVPFSYKCYICSKAWWHYYDFRQHFLTHDQAELDIELFGNECTVISFKIRKRIFVKPIDESCWRCGQDFTVHQVNKKGNMIYMCKGCLKKFMSCTLLNEHSGNCEYFKRMLELGGVKTNNLYLCRLCPVRYFSAIELQNHMKSGHSVRSDLPAITHLINCPNCNLRSIDTATHECNRLLFKKSCEFCKRNFQKECNLRMHQIVIKKNHKCIICGKILISDCMEVDHLLTHSSTYCMVYKCRICPNSVYFLNEQMTNKHRLLCHHLQNINFNDYCFERRVVPTTLLKVSLLKTYVAKVNTGCDGDLEMEVIDFNKDDSKKFNVDNIDTVTYKNTNEVLPNIDEESTITNTSSDNDRVSAIGKVASYFDQMTDINLKNCEPILDIKIKEEKPDIEDYNEYSSQINIKQEPMDIDLSKGFNEYNFNINNMVIKEDIVEHVADVCGLNNDIKIEVNDNSFDITNDMVNDNDFEDDTMYNDRDDKDVKLINTSKIYSCKKCPYKGTHRHYKQHIKERCQNSFYTCTKCNARHRTMRTYLNHFQKHKYSPETCPKCLKQIPAISELVTHVYQHIKNNFVCVHFIKEKTFNKCYQCRQCRDNVASSDFFMHWESHIEIKNLGIESESNDLVEKKPILQDLISLLQGEIPKLSKETVPKKCVMCSKDFSRKNDLKRHLIEHLLRDAYQKKDKYECLKCQICSIGFNKIDIYKRHMRDHASLPLYKCEICDKTFSDSSNFSKHKKVHNLSVLVCDICKKKFTCKAFLIKHMEMHEQLKPIVCGCCSRVFHSQSSYRKHRNGRYRFKCPACSHTFDSLKEKWDHMWLKHKERKYQADCPICKKSFRKYQDVKMHIKTTHDSSYVYKPDFVKINKNEIIVCE